jgi:hypothetical protein
VYGWLIQGDGCPLATAALWVQIQTCKMGDISK